MLRITLSAALIAAVPWAAAIAEQQPSFTNYYIFDTHLHPTGLDWETTTNAGDDLREVDLAGDCKSTYGDYRSAPGGVDDATGTDCLSGDKYYKLRASDGTDPRQHARGSTGSLFQPALPHSAALSP